MQKVIVGLDLHLKKTHGTVMAMDGKIVRQERFDTNKDDLQEFLRGIPKGTQVALESVGFCWPWIGYVEELGYTPLLANPLKLKLKAEDTKTDRIDSEWLARLTRMGELPTVYVPDSEMRWLRSLLRHRAFRRKIATALKNRTWSELRKRDIKLDVNLGTKKGKRAARAADIYEVSQNLEILEVIEEQMKQIEARLKECYGNLEPVRLLQSIPGIGFLTALTIYAEVCDIRRFSNPDKLAHYAGLVPKVRQSGEHTWTGRETRANRWLKWALTEAAWSHVNWCPESRLAKAYECAYNRKKRSTKAIKVVARKLSNVVWGVWTYRKEFTVIPDKV